MDSAGYQSFPQCAPNVREEGPTIVRLKDVIALEPFVIEWGDLTPENPRVYGTKIIFQGGQYLVVKASVVEVGEAVWRAWGLGVPGDISAAQSFIDGQKSPVPSPQ